jgi:SET domain-containing protein
MTDGTPHRGVYTRLGASPKHGIGVFAIRDIPAGISPFPDEPSPLVPVSIAAVEALADPALRQMYVDFCPLVGGHYQAPSDFRLMSQSWYLNHADEPNIRSGPDLVFVTARAILKGEELTSDYRTYSEHAAAHIRAWRLGTP